MRASLLGSIVVHAIAGVVLVALASRDEASPRPPQVTTIEIVELAQPPRDPPATAPGGGGLAPAASAAPVPKGTPASARLVAHAGERRSRTARSEDRAISDAVAEADPRGAISYDAPVGGDGAGGGLGGGTGGGFGRGIGLGEGGSIQLGPLPPVPPPPPAREVSKARPAKLVYPKRERQVADGELFVARVTIDDEGYVVGARLVRGFGGPRDVQAADLIWKFRYAPALDDAGHPIRSTVDQKFLVE